MARIREPSPEKPARPLLTAVAYFLPAVALVALVTAFRFLRFGPVEGFWDRLLMECYGMLLNVAAVGGFVIWFQGRAQKGSEVRRCRDEIDDFREWRFQEAAFRIAGNIRRLNRNGVSAIDLSRCTLCRMRLDGVDLSGAVLVKADLQDAYLARAVLRSADLSGALLKGSFLWKADLSEAILVGADLRNANLEGADLSGAFLQGCDLEGANLAAAVLTGARGVAVEQLLQVRVLDGTELDPDIRERIQKAGADPPEAPQ